MVTSKSYLINICGPTAIGKTRLAIALAKHFKTEIISSDSRQFYKEMSIGTDKPSIEERTMVKHHFIGHKSINEDYSVGHFERDALSRLEHLFQNYKTVCMVGGSGLYSKAVINGLNDFPKIDPNIRKNLISRLDIEGLSSLQKQLGILDREYYKNVDTQNPHRVIRALEVCLGTGKPYSSFIYKEKTLRPFTTISVGLQIDRQNLYNRIDKRVDAMLEEGLEDEARALFIYKDRQALQTLGYKELFSYFEGKLTFEEAVAEIKKNTRRFSKRQLTWFRKKLDILWFDAGVSNEKIIKALHNKIQYP